MVNESLLRKVLSREINHLMSKEYSRDLNPHHCADEFLLFAHSSANLAPPGTKGCPDSPVHYQGF